MADVRKIPRKTVTILEPRSSLTVDRARHRQKRVAAYCRVSTDNEEQLTSYVNQKKVYTEMIAANPEWCFAGLFADEGISGTQVRFRPEFKKMIDECYAGKIDYIITKSVSRFARNTVECLDYVRILKSRGIGIIFEEQNIDTLKTDSELYLVIYAGFAQSESESISKNVTWTFRKKFEEGQVPFRYSQMLGYKKGADGSPEIVPEEAVIIEDIFELYLSGKTIREVADIVKNKYPVIPNGKKINFSLGSIQAILTNEKYCGDAILQKTVTIDCITKTRRKNTGEAPMYYVRDNHPAIIDRDKFNRVQTEMVSRTTKRPQSNKTTLTAQGKYSKYALTDISEEISRLNERISAIQKAAGQDVNAKGRMEFIEKQLAKMKGRIQEYDDFAETVVRQMVECVKVFDSGKVEVVFGGGYAVEERITRQPSE